jgi:hypothetical protein
MCPEAGPSWVFQQVDLNLLIGPNLMSILPFTVFHDFEMLRIKLIKKS